MTFDRSCACPIIAADYSTAWNRACTMQRFYPCRRSYSVYACGWGGRGSISIAYVMKFFDKFIVSLFCPCNPTPPEDSMHYMQIFYRSHGMKSYNILRHNITDVKRSTHAIYYETRTPHRDRRLFLWPLGGWCSITFLFIWLEVRGCCLRLLDMLTAIYCKRQR